MESFEKIEQIFGKEINKIHKILAHSYSIYFILFLIGVILDIVFKFRIFTNPTAVPVGIVFLFFASFLILWAQKSSQNIDEKNPSKESFSKGPYRYTRSPTHWGLFILMLGFGIIANALFVVLSTLISFLISRIVFLKKRENALIVKYGAPYVEYKKSVKLF